MSDSLSIQEVASWLKDREWEKAFCDGILAAANRLVSARLVHEVSAKWLDTGDVEITSSVSEKNGQTWQPVVAIWRKGDGLALEGNCQCPRTINCEHAAALLGYLAKSKERLERAAGGVPQRDTMIEGKILKLKEGREDREAAPANVDTTPRFLIRVKRRPEGERAAWMPEIMVEAFAVYDGHQVALNPGGHLPPIVLPDRKIKRLRGAEFEAMNCLYALNLVPGAEKPPQSLRKVEMPELKGTLWAPDTNEWPHPEFYWQRFRHEGGPALERRRWEVRYAPDVGYEPLIFQSKTWRAEIIAEGKGWFHLSAGFEIDGENFELQPILAALVKNQFLEVTESMPDGQEFMIFLPDGRGLALPVGRFRRLLKTLGELLEFKFGEGLIKLSQTDVALIVAGEESDVLQAAAPAEIVELGERLLHFAKIDKVAVPNGIEATLREYQLEGFYWLQFLSQSGLNGILADDMGLGKTLQSLTHITSEIESGRNQGRPSLVVAPTSVVLNWEREASKFAPGLNVLVLQGAGRKRNYAKILEADLLLTSYALLHRDLEILSSCEFHLLMLDEAQHIKNPGAQVSQAAMRLNSCHRVCLSGTPVENHLGELWSLMNFLMPGLLGTKESFRENYQAPIEKNGSDSKRKLLADRVGPLILRRTKNDVAKELPPKTEVLHPIEMTKVQKDLYETVRSTMDKQVRQALAIHGQEAQVVFLGALLKLRQICCHPKLLKEGIYGNLETESAKFEYLVELLATLGTEGHRVLLFSQFTSMLQLIEDHLQAQRTPYLKLTGETKDRQDLVERFQEGEGEVFLISLKAGGTGLTLTGADTVIHYDPWWNPAVENQATDRAYRIGQDNPVFVHKLICQNTVEERIQQMQEKKDDLAGDLLSGATSQLNLTTESMALLLGAPEDP